MTAPAKARFKDRTHAVVAEIRKAICEVGWPNHRDCFHNTAERDTWCHPCTLRWAARKDAARFVAPKDDVL